MLTGGVILACLATSAAFDPAGVVAALDSAVAPALGSALKVLGQDGAAAVIYAVAKKHDDAVEKFKDYDDWHTRLLGKDKRRKQ